MIENGPTYRSRFSYSTGPGEQWRLEEDSHHTVMVYIANVDLTIAYGMTFDFRDSGPDREFEWSKAFPDSSVQIDMADFFWRGSLIDRVDYAYVDGARGIVPMGGGYLGLKVTSYEVDVARLLHNVKGGRFFDFDHYFGRIPFEITG
ncbi:hypothetical protein NJB1507_46260 [Mycobacterium marinum]|nr:hypothetical protein NJB1507_46260 [Mycobacterium marinum]